MTKETMSKADAASNITKAILADVKNNKKLMKLCVNQANQLEKIQVDADDVDTEMAFSLWLFSFNMTWLDANIGDEGLRSELIALSTECYVNFTGIPQDIVENWISRMRVGMRLTQERGQSGFMALPIMFYFNYGDLSSLQVDLVFSPTAMLYLEYPLALTGYWSRFFKYYDLTRGF